MRIQDNTKLYKINSKLVSMLIFTIFILSFYFFSNIVKASEFVNKTPEDVYAKVEQIKLKVLHLRKINNLQDEHWLERQDQHGKHPRHVFEKSLEILEKINRYRIIKEMGEITIPYFSGRNVTNNEVDTIVYRLIYEFNLLLPEELREEVKLSLEIGNNKTSNDVYKSLWEVSTAMDAVLGVRGFTPSDTFYRAKQITDLIIQLRESQGEYSDVKALNPVIGKHPNHALKEVNNLLRKIKVAEQQLWMTDSIEISPVPRRVITPTEVYDATGVVLAELERIEFRLGLDNQKKNYQLYKNKTPNDVINEIYKASSLFPDFSLPKDIVQYNPSLLNKTPNDVFALVEYMDQTIISYKKEKNIVGIIEPSPYIHNLKPNNVYQKTLDCMKKIDNLRTIEKIGRMAVPPYPLREITPNEVYDLVYRLDQELTIIFKMRNYQRTPFSLVKEKIKYSDKTPSDVYQKIYELCLLLDSITEREKFSSDDIFPEVQNIIDDVQIIARNFNIKISDDMPVNLKDKITPYDIYELGKEILTFVHRMQKHTGMQDIGNIYVPVSDEIISRDIYDILRIIRHELTSLKVHTGISEEAKTFQKAKKKTYKDVYGLMSQVRNNMQSIFKDGSE